MNSHLNPLESRERHVIQSGTEILGGVLLTRAGIVVDVEENPSPYQTVLDDIDEKLAWEETRSITDILKAVWKAVDCLIPYRTYEYERLLKDEAKSRGVLRLTPEHEIGLSRFISTGGICHQNALLNATMLRLLQKRGDIGGEVNLESTIPNEVHPDRHTRVVYCGVEEDFTLDIVSGVHSSRPYAEPVVSQERVIQWR